MPKFFWRGGLQWRGLHLLFFDRSYQVLLTDVVIIPRWAIQAPGSLSFVNCDTFYFVITRNVLLKSKYIFPRQWLCVQTVPVVTLGYSIWRSIRQLHTNVYGPIKFRRQLHTKIYGPIKFIPQPHTNIYGPIKCIRQLLTYMDQ